MTCVTRTSMCDALRIRWMLGISVVFAILAPATTLHAQGFDPLEGLDPFERRWQMPIVDARNPSFPLLPGDDPAISRSIGDVSNGYLVASHRLRFPHPHLAILTRQSKRHLNYTSDAMAELVETAAAHTATKFPGAITYLGNFGAEGGGDIPYSVSHNSGRDADVAFFVMDEAGESYQMNDLLALDDQGVHTSEDASLMLRFDAARNWALVEGFMLWGGEGKIQYIFVSKALKAMLLDYARTSGARSDLIAAANRLLIQPRSALPHNDHFHLRIYCAEADVASGCEDRGTRQPGYQSYSGAKKRAVDRATGILKDGLDAPVSDELLVAAIRRATLLDARTLAPTISTYLSHQAPAVRAAAARALATLRKQVGAIAARLAEEEHPRVVAELIVALGDVGDRKSIVALAAALERPMGLELGEGELDARALIVDQLATSESERAVKPLVELLVRLEPGEEVLATRVEGALMWLTNQDARVQQEVMEQGVDAITGAWVKWFGRHGKKRRRAWLAEGFVLAGFELKSLDRRTVWTLCRAIGQEKRHVSYNAQRVLMRLFSHTPASLSWSREDASFYWRRWLERRRKRLGLPRIPADLSTLK